MSGPRALPIPHPSVKSSKLNGYPSIRSKALSSDTPPEAVREHRFFASFVEDESHWSLARIEPFDHPPPP